jgi:hypothetical protein
MNVAKEVSEGDGVILNDGDFILMSQCNCGNYVVLF